MGVNTIPSQNMDNMNQKPNIKSYIIAAADNCDSENQHIPPLYTLPAIGAYPATYKTVPLDISICYGYLSAAISAAIYPTDNSITTSSRLPQEIIQAI